MRNLLIATVLSVVVGVCGSAAQANIGDLASNPGISAKHILEAGASVGDGYYWLDPNGGSTADALLGYCDMSTDGGGWTLGVHSVTGDPSLTTDMVSNTGPPSLRFGQTRDLSPLAIDQDAELRHVLTDADDSMVFDAKYSGRYHDPMAVWDDWTTIGGYTAGSELESMIDYHFGQGWTSETQDNDNNPGNGAVSYGVP